MTSFKRSCCPDQKNSYPLFNVGLFIQRFIEHVTNATINERSDTNNWGFLHLIGHSLGAHICGMAAKELKKRRNKWMVRRITGLDPAQPCFRNTDPSIHLNKNDAPFVDVIHTNGKLLISLGLGLPEAVGMLYKKRKNSIGFIARYLLLRIL